MLTGALLENRKTIATKNNYYFSKAIAEIIAKTPAELFACFAAIEKWQQANHYLVGYVAYEAGLYLQQKLHFIPKKITTPLLHFIVYQQCNALDNNEVNALLEAELTKQSEHFIYNTHLFDYEYYAQQLQQIKTYLINGDTYQVNFTGKYHFDFQGEPLQLYKLLRQQQRVEYSAYLDFGDYQILSISPELFFKRTATQLICKPMKGTAAKVADQQQDLLQQQWLQQDEKNCAENLMIVDLMRNDINKIAATVQVEKLFAIESFETLHQMVSLISAAVPLDLSFEKIITHLFPCGSITGAPKLRTMEIINELEKESRGIYTGALGYIMPNNDMCFNVAIRSLLLQGRHGELGVGSGIVADSEPQSEWQEIQTKLKFVTDLPVSFNLIESFLYTNNAYRYIELHLQRLAQSAKYFNFQCNIDAISRQLSTYRKKLNPNCDYKVRLLLHKNGELEVSHQLIDSVTSNKIIIATEPTDSQNILFKHKTTAASVRNFYDQCFKKYNRKNAYFDVLFHNENNEITEGSRSNIFIEKNGQIYTPPISSGLLPGIMRQQILQQKKVQEQAITLQSLIQADKIWLSNSVRGLVPVELLNANDACLL